MFRVFWVALFWYLLQKIILTVFLDQIMFCFFEWHYFDIYYRKLFLFLNQIMFCVFLSGIFLYLVQKIVLISGPYYVSFFFCVTIFIFIAEKHSYFWTILCFLFLFKWHYFDMYYSHLFLFRTLKTTGSPQKVVKFYTVKILYNLVL